MSVKDLIILGTSSQQPTRKRNHGGYLLRWREKGFLFDPGEGTQRQFIFAEVAPTVVTYIFVSHFHGDHCLGLGSMLMRLNLDKVSHKIHCFYPASGAKFFQRLRYGTIYHENIEVVEHPIKKGGQIFEDEDFVFFADFLEHGAQNLGFRIEEKPKRRFYKEKLQEKKIKGPLVKLLEEKGSIIVDKEKVVLEEVSYLQKGDIFSYIIDTRPCKEAVDLAKEATLLLAESTFLEDKKDLAKRYHHMTAKEAASLAKKAGVKKLVLTHFSARYTDERLFEKEAQEVFPNTVAAKDLMRLSFSEKEEMIVS